MKPTFIDNFNKKIPVGSLFSNMLILLSGTVLSRIVALAAIPYITRLYSPADFGIFSVFAALTSSLLPLASLRYTTATPLPKNDGTAVNILALCSGIILISTTILFLIFLLYGHQILTVFNVAALIPYWWLILVSFAGAGTYEIFADWAVRTKAFKPLAKAVVWQSFSSAAIKISLGLLGMKPLGLLLGHIASQAGGIMSLAVLCFTTIRKRIRHITFARIIFLAKRFSEFPKYRLPSQFLLAFSISSPLLFSAILFGQEMTGQLGLAITSLALPMSILGNTTGKAYYAEIAGIGRKDPEKILEVTRNVVQKLLLFSLPPFIILLLTGPWLFTLVFGDSWYDAGQFARILACSVVAQFISAPIVNVFNVLEKQKLFLLFNLMRLFLIFTVFGIAYVTHLAVYETIFILSMTQTTLYVFVNASVFKVLKCSIH